MRLKCPGSQQFSQPYPEPVECPHCGAEAEIWSDEAKAVCDACGKEFLRDTPQSCLDWCRYARGCVGEGIYKKYLDGKMKTERRRR